MPDAPHNMSNASNSLVTTKSKVFDLIRTIVYALLIALGIRTIAFEPFNIPSGSMIPTLLVGDFVFVSKYTYGYSKHSILFSPNLFSGRIMGREPKRGDVVVFKLPSDNSTDYIKRVIGMPGDTIQMINGRLVINGQEVRRDLIGEYLYRETGGYPVRTLRYIETLPGGKQHEIIERSDREGYDNTKPYNVPAGHYFMMGDNRDNSEDSRGAVGFVPYDNLVGRAEFLFLSVDGSLLEFWKWPWTVRFGRFLNGVN